MSSPESQTDFPDNLPQPSYESSSVNWRKLRLLIAAMLLLVGGIAAAWRLLSPINQAPAANTQSSGVRVKVSPVQVGIIEDSTDFVASLESRLSIKLQPRSQGQVTQIYVKSGDAIAAGAAVMQIDPRQQPTAFLGNESAINAAKAQLANAYTTLRSLETERLSKLADLRLNQQEYQRYASLANEGAVSRQAKEQAANRVSIATSSLKALESRIQAQKASIAQAQATWQQAQTNAAQQQPLQSYKITAPLSGTVGNIPVKLGDFVTTSTQLTTITQNQPLEVNISVPLERASQLRKGMPVEIMNPQGQVLGTSRVFFIAPNATNDTQTILIKAIYPNSNHQLRADQLIRARVIWSQRPGVLIPTTAVSRIAGNTFVYVAQTETSAAGSKLVARQKRVKLGDIRRNHYQVLSGLQPQDKIIVSGLLNLQDGVSIVPDS